MTVANDFPNETTGTTELLLLKGTQQITSRGRRFQPQQQQPKHQQPQQHNNNSLRLLQISTAMPRKKNRLWLARQPSSNHISTKQPKSNQPSTFVFVESATTTQTPIKQQHQPQHPQSGIDHYRIDSDWRLARQPSCNLFYCWSHSCLVLEKRRVAYRLLPSFVCRNISFVPLPCCMQHDLQKLLEETSVAATEELLKYLLTPRQIADIAQVLLTLVWRVADRTNGLVVVKVLLFRCLLFCCSLFLLLFRWLFHQASVSFAVSHRGMLLPGSGWMIPIRL
jgi:hypothetical protein